MIVRPKKCGIYFLLKNGYPVYIGQTRNLFQRVAFHDNQRMDYSAARFIACSEDKQRKPWTDFVNKTLP